MEKHVIDIDENIAMDIEQLTNGGFSPLKTFMNFTVFNKFFLANFGKTSPSILPFVGKILAMSVFR